MNYYRLSNDITDVVIVALQHFEHIDKKGPPQTFEEATKSVSGGFERYRSDPIFRAKVQKLVSLITATVQEHDEVQAAYEAERHIDLEKIASEVAAEWQMSFGGIELDFALEVAKRAVAAERDADRKRIAELEKALRDADSWVKAGEGVHLEYYYEGYGEDDSVAVIEALRSNA